MLESHPGYSDAGLLNEIMIARVPGLIGEASYIQPISDDTRLIHLETNWCDNNPVQNRYQAIQR